MTLNDIADRLDTLLIRYFPREGYHSRMTQHPIERELDALKLDIEIAIRRQQDETEPK